ncbi:hypothetical protein SAMN02745165_01746 [Malonomonas rubra DSM 5091]|uniref:Uncharacterized protein n=1 Tax=Malonomonas rubra DSM 5091 TaxID=1122189 RepID=A0A1M6H9F9_MALRU|nr:hypothetical protein [Malonomonas rubra]SHJ18890.1 hypothetical protein SAMN02745165_01746 [Malonomonas rubra DSM 5091]
MRIEIENKLVQEFPKLFPGEPAIMIDDGWFDLVYQLCNFLQHSADQCGDPQIACFQIKEKFGGMRFDIDGECNDYQAGAIQFAQLLSGVICDKCGRPGTQQGNSRGWCQTRCTDFAE